MEITFAGITQGAEEYEAVLKVLLSKWHATGKECLALEKEIAEFTGAKHCIVLNSGSSANYLSIKALDLPKGSKVLTSACGFPATLYPILHCGLEPALVDYSLPSHNIDLEQIKQALKKDKSIKAIILAHTMGNPVDMQIVMRLANKYKVKVIEDCCEAIGSKIYDKSVGTFGYFGTFSFYPSHQINGLGGGGCIITDDLKMTKKLLSMREWGKKVEYPFNSFHQTKFENKIDGIPYDSHYTYENLGFNFKLPDTNCAYARVQLRRLPEIIRKREENYVNLNYLMSRFGIQFIPMEVHKEAEPSYFGYILTLGKLSPKIYTRDSLLNTLEKNNIRTRLFFAGNITRHKPFRKYFKPYPIADYLMKNSLFVGVWQGLSKEDIAYIYYVIETNGGKK